ncbi:MAG: hypothetical protein ACPIOQ_53865 [Promethearchaeia archaeon]
MPTYARQHRCAHTHTHSEHAGCGRLARYGEYVGGVRRRAQWCRVHRSPHHVDVLQRRCQHPSGCQHAASRCLLHLCGSSRSVLPCWLLS